MEEEHAPQKLYRGELPAARCLCCGSCNDDAHPYEHGAAPRIALRRANHSCRNFGAFTAATSGLLLSSCATSGTTRGHELALDRLVLPMQITDNERLVELKSALLIAFAALGHTYVLGSGPDQVRAILARRQPPGRTCLSLPKQYAELGNRAVLVIDKPVPAILVLYPSPHCTSGMHAVLLPPAEHEGDFYRLWEMITASGSAIGVSEHHTWPEPRQLPFHWDECAGQHPRMKNCFGFELDADTSVHYGWRHVLRPVASRAG